MKMDAYFQQSVLYGVMYMVFFVLFCVCMHVYAIQFTV